MALAPTVPLLSGGSIPQLGFGTWPLPDDEAESTIIAAIGSGYRMIDTAENYRNEQGVGRGVRASGLPREELFVTSKFNKEWHGVDLAQQALEASLQRLGLDYLDLLLIHWPNPDYDHYIEAWAGLIKARETGHVRAIGTSNFKPAHLERIIAETNVVPDVNQVQLNPSVTRAAAREYHAAHKIVTVSWGPLGGDGARLTTQPVITEMAERYGRTPAQIVLRWHIELGLVPIPKSADRGRIAANIDVFDFALSTEDVAAISALDRGAGAGADSDTFGH